jgi:hypothetical protein
VSKSTIGPYEGGNYADRRVRKCIIAEGARVAFVSLGALGFPGNLMLWVKTDLCVAFVACPTCKAKRGELCRRGTRTFSYTHVERRAKFQRDKKNKETI